MEQRYANSVRCSSRRRPPTCCGQPCKEFLPPLSQAKSLASKVFAQVLVIPRRKHDEFEPTETGNAQRPWKAISPCIGSQKLQ
eukprot:2485131-Amphidinium_carterae.1